MCRMTTMIALTGPGFQLVSSWQTKIKWAVTQYKPYAIYTNTSIPGPATNHCLGNRLKHKRTMEFPSNHKISHSTEFRLTLLVTQLRAYFIVIKLKNLKVAVSTERLLDIWDQANISIITVIKHIQLIASHFHDHQVIFHWEELQVLQESGKWKSWNIKQNKWRAH